MNLVFDSGDLMAISIQPGERRYLAEGYETHTQPRLFIERFQLVQAPTPRHAPTLWAMPGGGRATTAQLLALARQRGWKRPRVVEVTVRYRAEVA
jgi:hypothetical protein